MAVRPVQGGRAFFVVIALGAAAGLGAWWTYPHMAAGNGSLHLILLVLGLVLLALPVFMAEAGLGQFRRRNVVDAVGPGPWRFAGAILAAGALLAAALVAVVTGWAGRIVVESFGTEFLADPARNFRLLSQGSDALLGGAVVLLAATLISARGLHRGVRPTVFIALLVMFVLLGGLVVYGNTLDGAGASRTEYLRPDVGDLSGADFVRAGQQALLVLAVGLGIVATLSGDAAHDRKLPREAFAVVAGGLAVILAIGLFLVPLAASNDVEFTGPDTSFGGLFTTVPEIFAAVGGSTGAMLTGIFFAALAASGVAAILALLEVPVTFLADRWPEWGRGRASMLSGLVVYFLAIPFAFSRGLVSDGTLLVTMILVPLGGLLLSLRVGWAREAMLDGYTVGDVQHKVEVALRPWLRFATPVICAFLVLIGFMAFFAEIGSVTRGAGGLWSWVP